MKWGENRSPEVLEFLQKVVDLCAENGFSLSHEDRHGSFEVVPYNDDCTNWLLAAQEEMQEG